jgi:hypothetical protein
MNFDFFFFRFLKWRKVFLIDFSEKKNLGVEAIPLEKIDDIMNIDNFKKKFLITLCLLTFYITNITILFYITYILKNFHATKIFEIEF